MKQYEIERKANLLLRQLGINSSGDDIGALTPSHVIEALGYKYVEVKSLEWPPGNKSKSFAGQIDRNQRTITIATKFPREVQRFTAYHEIGHLVLHDKYESSQFHRDMPLSGEQRTKCRPPIEREADCFAGFFLMPRRLVSEQVEVRFGLSSLAGFNWEPALAFHMSPINYHVLLANDDGGKRARSLAMAGASYLDQVQFDSLAKFFGVSVGAMAIQLEILGLVD